MLEKSYLIMYMHYKVYLQGTQNTKLFFEHAPNRSPLLPLLDPPLLQTSSSSRLYSVQRQIKLVFVRIFKLSWVYGFFKAGKEKNAYSTQTIISVYQANEGTTGMVFMRIRKLPRGPQCVRCIVMLMLIVRDKLLSLFALWVTSWWNGKWHWGESTILVSLIQYCSYTNVTGQ